MIYQVLSRPRTGSHLISSYAWNSSSEEAIRPLSEYFDTQDTHKEYESKFEFLETEKDNDRHYCLKVQVHQIREVPRIINYLKDYHVCITKRNPWDSYLSYTFCDFFKWEVSHRDLEGKWSIWTKEEGKRTVEIDEDNFVLPINEKSIIKYIKVYKRDISMIEKIKSLLPNYTVFEYETFLLNKPRLKQFFNKKEFTEVTQQTNMDYEAHIPFGLVDHYKTMFDKYLNE